MWARPGRTGLLVACVALCCALVVGIQCAVASLNRGLQQRVESTVGRAHLRLAHPGKAPFDRAIARRVAAWPEVAVAAPKMVDGLPLLNRSRNKSVRAIVSGVEPASEALLTAPLVEAGAWFADGPAGDAEPAPTPDDQALPIVLDKRVADELQVAPGEVIEIERFGPARAARVIGVVTPPPLSALFKNQLPAFVRLADLAKLAERPGQVQQVDIVLKPGADPAQVAKARQAQLPPELLLLPTAMVTAGFDRQQQLNQVGLILASLVAFLASGFIIGTGMNTAVGEQTRQLAILRCIGASRAQLAWSQVMTGVQVGVVGALAGLPLGVAGAWAVVKWFPTQLPAGFVLSWTGVASGVLGALVAGVIGASLAAWNASRTSPLAALGQRAQPFASRSYPRLVLIGLGLLGVHALVIVLGPSLGKGFFWVYAPLAVPCMLAGYFVLSVPLTRAVALAGAGLIGRGLGVPGALLASSMRRTPVKHGLTAGSMMLGLSMLVSIWTSGSSVLGHWLDSLQFPDAFVTGLSLKPDTAERVRRVPGVQHAAAITLHNVDTDAMGIGGLTRYRTTFMGFEPEPFFAMTRVQWVEGDEAGARAALARGGAVIVAKEFRVARGLGLGDRITLGKKGADGRGAHEFAIVGVVTSPGLDIASKFFDIGEGYVDQAISSVFGSRADLIEKFGNDSVSLVQIGFAPGADPEETMRAVRALRGTGILAGGTATAMKAEVRDFLSAGLRVFSLIAIAAMVVASLGVANVIVAGVQARAFEMGVLRATGATRWMLARLVLGEALIIGLASAILGTLLGVQGTWGGHAVTASSIGIQLPIGVPAGPTAWAALGAVAITLLAALPPALALARRQPRELLGVVRG